MRVQTFEEGLVSRVYFVDQPPEMATASGRVPHQHVARIIPGSLIREGI